MLSSEWDSGIAPWRETLPQVVFSPVTPHAAAGTRTEPPASEPSAPKTRRAAAAAPEPLEEPPAMQSGVQGLRHAPQGWVWPGGPEASAGVVCAPISTR